MVVLGVLLVQAGGPSPDCIVCQEPLSEGSVVLLPCAHFFHRTCIGQWLRRNASCPTCAASLLDAIILL